MLKVDLSDIDKKSKIFIFFSLLFFKTTFPFGVGAKRRQLLCEEKKKRKKKEEAVLQLPHWWHLYRVAGGMRGGYALSVVSA